ncbi:hypothetical protein [Magnetospira sp. QH-2]|uniref:hypothetical protein n=1 Tax=Magnetospira sp. (strain QH-2) TaxID=1288970 RepID=UPI0003E81A76|nr:hypothetical protein [Magnetospira sp. QH-2]CCQ73619.1 Exported protein of unknown function [Magnetospira sp. QH-2]
MRVLLSVLALILLAQPANAQQRCPGGDTLVDVALTSDRGGVRFYNTKTLTDLKRMTGPGNYGNGERVLGLTRRVLDYRLQARTRTTTTDGRRYCVSLSRVDLHLGFKDFEVYIARKYRPGSCAYRVTKEHELTHVALYRRELADSLAAFKARVIDAAMREPVVWTSDINATTQAMLNRLSRRLQADLRRLEDNMDRANSAIDTPEAYRQEHNKCRDW